MGGIGLLTRKLDPDAIARVRIREASGEVPVPRQRSSGGTPRDASTYRAARRNLCRDERGMWRGTLK